VVGRTNPASCGRGTPAGPRSHGPRSLSVSQPLPLLHVLNQFRGVRQVSHQQYLRHRNGGKQPKSRWQLPLFSRESPFLTPLPRFLAGNWLFPGADGFTMVYGTSGCQGLAHLPGSPTAGSLPCFYDSREKFVHFASATPGRARLVRARACRGQNSDFEKILCQNIRHDLEAFRWFYASETPIFKKTVGTFLG
jgi:hypothetical protein